MGEQRPIPLQITQHLNPVSWLCTSSDEALQRRPVRIDVGTAGRIHNRVDLIPRAEYAARCVPTMPRRTNNLMLST
jgi:hypothetical protein